MVWENRGTALLQSTANSSKLNMMSPLILKLRYPEAQLLPPMWEFLLRSFASPGLQITFLWTISFQPSVFTYLFLLPTYPVPTPSVCPWELTVFLVLLCRGMYFALAYCSSFWIKSQSLLFHNQTAIQDIWLSKKHFLLKTNFISRF